MNTVWILCITGGGWGMWQIRDFILVFVHNNLSVDQISGKITRSQEERGTINTTFEVCTEHCLCRHNKCIYRAISIEICHPTPDPRRGDSGHTNSFLTPEPSHCGEERHADRTHGGPVPLHRLQVPRYLDQTCRRCLTMFGFENTMRIREGLESWRLSGYLPPIMIIIITIDI